MNHALQVLHFTDTRCLSPFCPANLDHRPMAILKTSQRISVSSLAIVSTVPITLLLWPLTLGPSKYKWTTINCICYSLLISVSPFLHSVSSSSSLFSTPHISRQSTHQVSTTKLSRDNWRYSLLVNWALRIQFPMRWFRPGTIYHRHLALEEGHQSLPVDWMVRLTINCTRGVKKKVTDVNWNSNSPDTSLFRPQGIPRTWISQVCIHVFQLIETFLCIYHLKRWALSLLAGRRVGHLLQTVYPIQWQ